MATYNTKIQWGGRNAAWHDDAPLNVFISNRMDVIPVDGPVPNGAMLSWSGPQGSGEITFYNDGAEFIGSAQFPGEGPVGYRGVRTGGGAGNPRLYNTQIQWGGFEAAWHDDHPIQVQISNRHEVVTANVAGTGTLVNWSSDNGNGNITFYSNGYQFSGSAKFAGEGPVGYRSA